MVQKEDLCGRFSTLLATKKFSCPLMELSMQVVFRKKIGCLIIILRVWFYSGRKMHYETIY